MGTNGAVMVDPTKAKCPKSPTKFRYLTVEDAWAKARERSTPKLEIVPYACDGCGNYHLADARNVGPDIAVAAPVGVTTEATSKVLSVPKFEPPERNWDAVPIKPSKDKIRRDKQRLITEFLANHESATTQELKALIGVSTNAALRPYMKGWYNTRGREAKWVPVSQKKVKTVNPVVDIKPKPKPAVPTLSDVDRFGRTQEEQAADPVVEVIAAHPAGKARSVAPPVSEPQWLSVPISNYGGVMRNIKVQVPGPLTEDEWARFHIILEALKPGLVQE